MPFFDIFASPRRSPLRMRTKVASFFIFFQDLSNQKIKALRPKMTKIASRGGSCLNLVLVKFSQKHTTHLFLTENRVHSGAVTYMIQSKFFSHAFVDSEIAEVVDRWLWSEWSSVQMRSAPFPFLLHFFLWSGRARLRCRFDDPLTWQGQRLNSYRSGWRRPLSSSLDRCWVWLSKRLKFFGLSAARILPVPTYGRPVALRIVTVNQAISGRSFFLCLFRVF